MTPRRTRKWLAIVFALVALLLVVAATWLGRSARVLEMPIRLTPEFRVQSAFRVWRKADYRISVYCSSPAEKEHFRKLLQGGNLVQITVSGNGDAVLLHLFPEPLFRPGIVSTDEWGNIVFGQNEAGQDIADFAADPGSALSSYLLSYSPRHRAGPDASGSSHRARPAVLQR
jgi:hypothetical protein